MSINRVYHYNQLKEDVKKFIINIKIIFDKYFILKI